ncbi:hypothetical protein MASR2M78_31070 [Treponema sp.]
MKNLKSFVFILLVLVGNSYAQNKLTGSEQRLVVGGRGAALVVDALYAFPDLRSRLVATVKPEGFGLFLNELDPDFASKAYLTRTAGAESYAAIKPDVVLLKSYMKNSLGSSLAALGIKTAYFDLESPEDYYKDLTAIGAAFNMEERAAELTSFYRRLQEDTQSRVGSLPPVRTLLIQAGAGTGVWEATPAGWMQTRLVSMAGGLPVWTPEKEGPGTRAWLRLGAEQISAWNPEVVIIVSYRVDSAVTAATFKNDSRFSQLQAVKSGRVYAMPQDYYSWDQPVTRWILALRRMAALMHPEAFTDVNPGAEARAFFNVVYGFSDSQFNTIIRGVLKGDHGVD